MPWNENDQTGKFGNHSSLSYEKNIQLGRKNLTVTVNYVKYKKVRRCSSQSAEQNGENDKHENRRHNKHIKMMFITI